MKLWMFNFLKRVIKKIMPILSNADQQKLYRRTWGNVSKKIYQEKMGRTMLVIGRVTGSVSISDIGKNIANGQVVEFNEYDVNKSKDLHQAIRMRWVEVIEDRGLLKRAYAAPSQPSAQTQDKEQMLQIAREMAKEMAREMLKDNTIVKQLSDEIKGLKDVIGEKIVVAGPTVETQKDKFVIKEEKPENIVIDVDESSMTTSKEVGKEVEEKADLSGSLEKMRKFRRKPKAE